MVAEAQDPDHEAHPKNCWQQRERVNVMKSRFNIMLDDIVVEEVTVKASELGGGGGGGACFTREGRRRLLSPHLIAAHLLHLDFKCPIFQVLVYICYYCTAKN